MPLPFATVSLSLIGLMNGMSVVLSLALIQEHVSKEMLGRIMSFVTLTSFGILPLAQLAAGLVAEAAGPELVLVGGSLLLFLGGAVGLMSRTLRQVD